MRSTKHFRSGIGIRNRDREAGGKRFGDLKPYHLAVYVHFEAVSGLDVIDIKIICWISMTNWTAYVHFYFGSGPNVIDFHEFIRFSMTFGPPYVRFDSSQTLS